MGTNVRQNIVTNGLVLYLDAGNRMSYPGSGTTWRDLSGNGNTGTLTNGPTFNSLNQGSIVFDGVDDHINVAHNTALNPGVGSFTFGCICKTTGNIPTGYFPNFISKSDGDWNNGYRIWPSAPYDGTYRIGVSQGGTEGVDRAIIVSTITAALNVWICITGVWDSVNKTLFLYINGQNNGTKSTTNSLTINPTSYLGIGIYNRSSLSRYEYINGNVASVQIYNRALSPQEVLQNYNATKTRFGLT